ncbi:helix-turn-helix transcriptional regulator [Nisaea acidiphila]|uniref:Helix-turn-helix transcriptional regulator n=1 Tax=Nisaea acidiphila TaxID=1862145 RepID=A0A9J7AP59_9PROT|nr:helix-turn-helix transcriptional regulator [Nisaea acidiphila]UUX48132.1 helix-turn-helix transcriptional regulator [Nisaea acidiphila]
MPADSPQIVVLGAFFAAGHDTGLHDHDRAQFVHAKSGMLQVWTEDGQWSVPSGMAVWVPAGVTHRVRAVGDAEFLSLYIRPAAPGERDVPVPDRCVVCTVPPLVRQLIQRLSALAEGGDPARAARVADVLADELGDLERTDLHLPIPSDRRAAGVARALLDHPGDDRSIAAWGREVGASGRTLTRLFLAETGMNFSEWRARCRLIAALELLAAGTSVTSVALEIGYQSPSAFAAAFSRTFGMVPREYRGGRIG